MVLVVLLPRRGSRHQASPKHSVFSALPTRHRMRLSRETRPETWHMPTEKTSNQSTHPSINQSIDQTINQSTGKPINQSINQSINRRTDQSINRSTERWSDRLVPQSLQDDSHLHKRMIEFPRHAFIPSRCFKLISPSTMYNSLWRIFAHSSVSTRKTTYFAIKVLMDPVSSITSAIIIWNVVHAMFYPVQCEN